MLGDNLVAVFAFLALGVGLEFFLGAVLGLYVAVMAGYGFVVYNDLLMQVITWLP